MSDKEYGLICPECGSDEVYYENPNTGSGQYTCQECEFMGSENDFNYNIPVKRYNDLRAKLDKAYRGLESLTPGGSEFHDDVKNCVDYIKDKITTLESLVKDHAKRRIAAEQERDNL